MTKQNLDFFKTLWKLIAVPSRLLPPLNFGITINIAMKDAPFGIKKPSIQSLTAMQLFLTLSLIKITLNLMFVFMLPIVYKINIVRLNCREVFSVLP